MLAQSPMQAVDHQRALGVQAEEVLIERSDLQIRLATSRGRRSRSSLLIQRMYSWRGYDTCADEDAARFANRVTLQACRGESVFGTISVNFDSDAGLAADALYRSEIDAYRMAEAEVAEATQLAVDPEHGSKEVLGALFHLVYLYCLLRGVSHLLIEVNPRHVAFYRRMLGFTQAGECKLCERVIGLRSGRRATNGALPED
jgi:hypothetical protein